ncbi:MAG: transcriptional regulator [Candidatus Gastranaerophilales bacterium]|nr:transcriptional regulator [Candidatus Gastranaerophilales bacterium]MCM1072697.1 transcriptional regulator [Bacteroides sp.]
MTKLQEELKVIHHYTDSIFYEIELTAKYCKILGTQIFEDIDAGLSIDEFSTLDILAGNHEMCQRDIAKLLLKDRANTGKVLDSLESQGYIERELAVKNNRPVKISKLTAKGKDKVEEILGVLKPHTDMIKSKILNSDLKQLKSMLQEFREVLDETLEIKI